MSTHAPITRVAVVDDNPDDRDMLVWSLEDADYVPVVVGEVSTVDAAVREIRARAQAVVCDHQLKWGSGATFTGAELAARCFQLGMPAVLVTSFFEMDADSGIRVHRRNIPVLIPRDELDAERLVTALDEAALELQDQPSSGRVPWRALVRVVRVRSSAAGSMLDVVIPQWNPHKYVSLPLRMLGDLVPAVPGDLEDHRFFALVNTGTENPADLYFDDFRDAGEAPDEDDLT